MLTCGYGLSRTGWTCSIGLRICDGSSCLPLARGGRFRVLGLAVCQLTLPIGFAALTMFIEELCGMLVHLGPAGVIQI
jgi:hypothetical protein